MAGKSSHLKPNNALLSKEDKIMGKWYILTIATSSNSTLFVVLEDLEIKGDYVKGTKVGKLLNFDINGNPVFAHTERTEFMAGGGPWTIEEYKHDLV